MRARIYLPAKTAMQSGVAKTHRWVLEFTPATAREIDPLMGWTSSKDTQSQIRMFFESCEKAENYAKSKGIEYSVIQPHYRQHVVRQAGYGENFATNRRSVWTH